MKRKEEKKKEEERKRKEGKMGGGKKGGKERKRKEGEREGGKGREEGAGKNRPGRRLTLLILLLNAYPSLGQTKEGQVVTWVVTRVGYFKNIHSAQQLS